MHDYKTYKKELKKGEEVLIFKGNDQIQIDEIYIRGTVISCQNSENELIPTILTVLGEDGCEYYGCYGSSRFGSYFFRTKEDQIKHLKSLIAINNDAIEDLKDINERYSNAINDIENLRPQKKLRILKK